MNSKLLLTLAGSALAVIAFAGCSTPDTAETPAPPAAIEPSPSESAEPTETAGADAATASSTLGEIIVDGQGMTAYIFDKDVADSGVSTCEGDCLVKWPPITAASDTPTVTGITGEVGTITGTDGSTQITVNGLPIYLFIDDTAPGDVTGQGVGGVWWVLDPAGEKISTPAAG